MALPIGRYIQVDVEVQELLSPKVPAIPLLFLRLPIPPTTSGEKEMDSISNLLVDVNQLVSMLLPHQLSASGVMQPSVLA